MAKQTRPSSDAPQRKQSDEPRNPSPAESTPGGLLWRLSLLLCTGIVILGLLFAAINGGSEYVGKNAKPKATPTPTPPLVDLLPDGGDLLPDGSDVTPTPEVSPTA